MFRNILRRTFCKNIDSEMAGVIDKKYQTLYEGYNVRPQELNSWRKQLVYRSKNLGMKELDILVGKWAEMNMGKLKGEDLKRYEEEVINIETPDLYKILSANDEGFKGYGLPKGHFLNLIRKLGEDPNWERHH